jgi:DNA-binding ferritin-like protein (Dps family)
MYAAPIFLKTWLDLDAASTLHTLVVAIFGPPDERQHDMTKWRDEKKRYQQYKARKEQLPASYREAVDAVERYALRFGPGTGETVVTMLEDLIEIVEHGMKGGAPVREIVGDDPVRLADDFLKNYPANPSAAKEQQRLADTINHAARSGA